MEMQIPKGTFDILPYGTDETWRLSDLWQYVEADHPENCFANMAIGKSEPPFTSEPIYLIEASEKPPISS